MKQQDENYLQNQCYIWFTNTYGLKHHNPRLLFYSVANELAGATGVPRNVISRIYSKFKLTGFKKGVADVHLCFPGGKLVYIEFKTATGRQSAEQKEFQQQVEALGFKYYIVRSLEEFKEIVCSHI